MYPKTIQSWRYPLGLLTAYGAIWFALAIDPVFRKDWLLENAIVFVAIPLFVLTARRLRFSDFAYTCLFVFFVFHAIGAHYTYSLVPYDRWFQSLFGRGLNEMLGLKRNQFDRLVHFCFGLLLAYPIRELFLRVARVRGFWGYYLPLDLTMSFSMLYELIEWAAASAFGGDLGAAYLGTQGDEWDAHKDMALATLGAVITMSVVAFVNWKYDRHFGEEMRESFEVKRKRPLGEMKLEELKRGS